MQRRVRRVTGFRAPMVLAIGGAIAMLCVSDASSRQLASSAGNTISAPAHATSPAVRVSMATVPTTLQPVAPVPTQPPATTAAPPTTTEPPVRGCKLLPSRCGYPDATNTGPPASTMLIPVPSQLRSGTGWAWSDRLQAVQITGANAVLDGLDISGPVVIDAPDATVSNSRIAACGGSDDGDVVAVRYREGDPSYNGSGARIVHNTLLGTPPGCTHRARSGIRDVYGEAPNLLVDGNNISGTGNGITAEYDATIVNNWVHDLGHLPGDHHSGISNHGGAKGIVIRHNTALLHGQSFPGGGGVSGAITVYADFGHAQNVTVEDNLISGGSYVVYGGESGDGYQTAATNIRFLSNRFVCGDWLYGPVAAFDPSSTGNAWTGNFCDQDGSVVRP